VASKQDFKYDDLEEIRRNSVIWGCPEWTKTDDFTSSFADKVRVGYGMQYYPTYFEDGDLMKLAYITSDVSRGQYIRQSAWTKAADRGLLIDSITHVVTTPQSFGPNTPLFGYEYTGTGTIPSGSFYVDAKRHLKRGTSKAEAYRSKGMNMLFCDGHAASVSPPEAWNAIHNPGEDRVGQ
jgi:prepilin-type processing-associated H-X9-DG protein